LCFVLLFVSAELTGWAVLPTRTAALRTGWARSSLTSIADSCAISWARSVGRDPGRLRDQLGAIQAAVAERSAI
jgi:hypothetical protein